MRRLVLILCCVAIAGIGTIALASGSGADSIGPLYNSRNQTQICLVQCKTFCSCQGSVKCVPDNTCRFTIKIKGPNGELLTSKTFNNVPDDGARMHGYQGLKNPITCQVQVHRWGDLAVEPVWCVLDNRGEVISCMTNDKSVLIP